MKKIRFKYAIELLTMIGLVCIGFLVYLYFSDAGDSIEFVKLQLEVLKIIIASVVIGLLGILIPDKLAQKKHDEELKNQSFELLCEGRRLYSIVKTGLDYLPYTLPGMSNNDASAHLEKIHQAYHLVMLYPYDENILYPDDEKLKDLDKDNLKERSYTEYFNIYKAFSKLEAAREILLDIDYLHSDLNIRHNMLSIIETKFKS